MSDILALAAFLSATITGLGVFYGHLQSKKRITKEAEKLEADRFKISTDAQQQTVAMLVERLDRVEGELKDVREALAEMQRVRDEAKSLLRRAFLTIRQLVNYVKSLGYSLPEHIHIPEEVYESD